MLVALCTHEEKTAEVYKWCESCKEELACAFWCVTEFASAMGLKQRTGQMNAAQARAARIQFERVCANDLKLLPISTTTFYKAALLTMHSSTGLRAGDALHLACAIDAKAQALVTLDIVLSKSAMQHHIRTIGM
jgi:predicted nucleic acid-binding protein